MDIKKRDIIILLHNIELGPYVRNSAERARYQTRPLTEFVDTVHGKSFEICVVYFFLRFLLLTLNHSSSLIFEMVFGGTFLSKG